MFNCIGFFLSVLSCIKVKPLKKQVLMHALHFKRYQGKKSRHCLLAIVFLILVKCAFKYILIRHIASVNWSFRLEEWPAKCQQDVRLFFSKSIWDSYFFSQAPLVNSESRSSTCFKTIARLNWIVLATCLIAFYWKEWNKHCTFVLK